MAENISNMIAECEALIKPSIDDNADLARKVLENTHGIVFGGPANPARLSVARGFWNMFFPDHCTGDSVFFVGAREIWGDLWAPAVIVSCSHFEHGDSRGELEALEWLARIIAGEAFGDPNNYNYEILVLNPITEKLVMVVTEHYESMHLYSSVDEAMRWIVKRLARLDTDEVPLDIIAGFFDSSIDEFIDTQMVLFDIFGF